MNPAVPKPHAHPPTAAGQTDSLVASRRATRKVVETACPWEGSRSSLCLPLHPLCPEFEGLACLHPLRPEVLGGQ